MKNSVREAVEFEMAAAGAGTPQAIMEGVLTEVLTELGDEDISHHWEGEELIIHKFVCLWEDEIYALHPTGNVAIMWDISEQLAGDELGAVIRNALNRYQA